MNFKERIEYSKNLFEKIIPYLEIEEVNFYDHKIIFKDKNGNYLHMDISYFKNEESYKDQIEFEEGKKEYLRRKEEARKRYEEKKKRGE
jgi:hypothetical protein